jgi:homoserine kinase type II
MAILTVLSEADLEAVASAYDLGALDSAEGIEAGTVNTSYRLVLGGRRFFLRVYEEQGAEGAAQEAALLRHLASAGVPTPTPEVGRDGETTRTVAGKPAALFPWIDGDIICTRGVATAHGEAVGVALARVHLAGPPPGRALGGGRFGPSEIVARCDRVATSRDEEARRLAGALRDAVRDVDARRRQGGGTSTKRGLVHGDLFRDNVLWDRDRIAALLDFESAHEGPFVFDLAVTILSWSFRDDFELPIARAIVGGYRSVRELDDGERAAFFDEAVLACLRFTVTRITDDAIRVGKRWQRFVQRREALEAMGPAGVREAFGL